MGVVENDTKTQCSREAVLHDMTSLVKLCLTNKDEAKLHQ